MADTIGVFDSGVGGISVLHELRKELPTEQMIYVADSGNCPYGNRGDSFIQQRGRQITEFLIEQGAKAIVIACNTATAAAAATLRAAYSLPIIGMEPAVKPAVAATRTGVVGVLATVGTSKSSRLTSLIERFGRGVEILTQPCPGLVELVEHGELDGAQTREAIQRFTEPLLAQGADTLVLGCTHYPFLAPAIRAVVGPEIVLIDTGAAVARQTKRVLTDHGMLASGAGNVTFWTTGSVLESTMVIQRLWGEPCEIRPVPAEVATITVGQPNL